MAKFNLEFVKNRRKELGSGSLDAQAAQKFFVVHSTRSSLAEKNPSVPVTCGKSVFISTGRKFSCAAKNFSTTDSFSRRMIVHVL